MDYQKEKITFKEEISIIIQSNREREKVNENNRSLFKNNAKLKLLIIADTHPKIIRLETVIKKREIEKRYLKEPDDILKS
ncbi:hypothetical protein [Mediterraneibacter gnavus]|uniref:hypothetical protein n=1 Tax=Mediterraneibacter gnavus TaxID=33038 RepID=UPI0034A1F5EF